MTSDEAAEPGDGKRGQLPFDISVAHQARMYDYVLGGKDNISQVVEGTPHTHMRCPSHTGAIRVHSWRFCRCGLR